MAGNEAGHQALCSTMFSVPVGENRTLPSGRRTTEFADSVMNMGEHCGGFRSWLASITGRSRCDLGSSGPFDEIDSLYANPQHVVDG